MRKILLAMVVAALTACNANTPAGQVVVKTINLASTDLTAANAVYVAAEPTDQFAVLGATCTAWMQSELPAIQAALAPATGGVSAPVPGGGVATLLAQSSVLFDSAQAGVQQVQAGLPPGLKMAFDQNCGPQVSHLIGGFNWLVSVLAKGAGGIAAGSLLVTP